MTLDLPGGFSSRPATRADADAILELITASELADDGVAEVDEGDIVPGFARYGFDPALDTIAVFEGDALVAWAEFYRGRAEAHVRPTHRGRGIGSELLAWTEDRARAHGNPDVGQSTSDGDAAARDLFLAEGYEPAWVSWIIRRDLQGSDAPEPPEGITIRPYRPSDARDVHAVIDAAFSEWPGRGPEPFEVWAPVVEHPMFVSELSPLGFDGDELVGVVLGYGYPEVGEGWIQQLATRGTHRRRGIAQALLRTAFAWFHARGLRIAGVATDSRTGALGLYEKVGMRVVRQYTRYAKDLG